MIFGSVARAFRLAPTQRQLSLEAFLLLRSTSLLLEYGSGRLSGRLIQRVSVARPGSADEALVAAVVAAVARAARHVPDATCLSRALTGWLMMTCRKETATVRLGVNRSGNQFAAHAWLECNGVPVIGGDIADDFVPFSTRP